MSDDVTIEAELLGTAEVAQRFGDMGAKVRGKVRAALARLGAEMVDLARGAAPRRTGKLADSIKARMLETDTDITETVRPSAFYAQFMEFGVVNHGSSRNRNVSGGVLTKGKGGKTVRRARVERVRDLRAAGQYRIAPRPFMGPVMEKMGDHVSELLNEAISEAATEGNG